MNDPDAHLRPIDTKFTFGRLGYEIGTQEATDFLNSGETLREFAQRTLGEQKKSGDAD